MSLIGPNFGAEIAAAGLAGLPFSWNPNGTLVFDPTMTTAQVAAVQAVLAAHNPATIPLAMQAGSILATGVTIASASTLVPTAVWPIDQATQAKMVALATVLNTLGTFPGGAQTWPVRDAAGTVHALSPTQFEAVQGACAEVAAQCDLAIDNLGTVIPSPSVSIA